MLQRRSALASRDSECSCSTVSSSVGAASKTGSVAAPLQDRIFRQLHRGSPKISSPSSSLHSASRGVWLDCVEESALVVVCASLPVHCGVLDRGHCQMPPRQLADLWARHCRVASCGDPVDQTWSECWQSHVQLQYCSPSMCGDDIDDWGRRCVSLGGRWSNVFDLWSWRRLRRDRRTKRGVRRNT